MTHGVAAILSGSWHSLATVSLGMLVVAVGLHVGKVCAEARAWHSIVSHAHDSAPVSFRTTLCAFVGSNGVNALLPARAGEALRVGIVRRRVPGSSAVTIAATIVLETAIEVVFGAVVIVAVIVAGRSFGPNATGPGLPEIATHPLVLGVAACLASAVVVLALVRRRRAARAVLTSMVVGFSITHAPRDFVNGVLSWKLVAWALRLGAVYTFLLAFHIPAAPWSALVVVAAQSVAASVPLLPGNAGTQQATIGVALAGSASATALLGFGVGMQAATTIADLVLGAAALLLVAERGDLERAHATLRLTGRARRAPA